MFEIGATLREARERRQLTYEQVEAEIKIRAKYLRALEEEEFDSLPSGTYVRGFLRAYASYLGLDGRLFVDEYASRFGTRHDDELFRRRRERPMTQRRESSSAVLVALIAVVAIGVLFFVAWRFGPGEAQTPSPTFTVTETTTQTAGPNENPSIVPQTAATTATTVTTLPGTTRVPVTLRVDVDPAKTTTWVKITRLSTAKAIAAQDVLPGKHLGGGALSGRLRLRGRDRPSRATSRWPSTTTPSRSAARARGSSRPTRAGRTSCRAKIPPAQATEGK